MISFAPTDDQTMAREMLESLAEDTLRPSARGADSRGCIESDVLDALWGTGLVDLVIESNDDDLRRKTSNAIALEAIGHGDAGFAVALAAPLGYAQAIMKFGTAEQREALTAAWSSGGFKSAAILVQERGFGLGTGNGLQVQRAGDGYVLSGMKAFVPRARACSDFLVVGACEQRLEAFLVPATTEGVEIIDSAGTLGLRSLEFKDVRLNDVKLGSGAKLGGSNSADAQQLIDAARVAACAIMTGVGRAVLEHLAPYLKARVAHGSFLAQKQSVAFRLADMAIDIPTMRWMTWWAAVALDDGQPATREARLAHLHCSEQAMWITDEGIQLMGGHGYMRDNPVERWYRDIRMLSTLEGMIGL